MSMDNIQESVTPPDASGNNKLEAYASLMRNWLSSVYISLSTRINWLLNFFTTTDDGEGGEFAPGFGPVSYIDFDIEYMDGQKEGRLQWNIDDGTLEVGMPGGSVNLQIGQETLVRVTNESGGTLLNGTPVYVSGSTGNNITVDIADADFATGVGLRTVGVTTEDIANNQKGYITLIGLVREIDTSMFPAAGMPVYLAKGGGFAIAPPTQPDISYVIGVVVRNHATEGAIIVLQTSLPNLNSLSDVYVTSQHDLALLMWNTATDRYEDDALPWNDLRIVPGSFQRAGNTDPTLYTWTPTGAGDAWFIYKFNKNDIVFASTQMPHSYKEGSDLQFHIHWTPADRGALESGSLVGWKVGYSIANVNEDFPIFQTLDLSDACAGVDDRHEITSSVTVDGTGLEISHIVLLRIFRSDTGADDTWAGTNANAPGLLEFDIHYQKDTIGSRNETSK